MPDGSLPPSGHNNPPPYREDKVAEHNAKAAEFLDVAGKWLDLKEIQTEDQAARLTDFITGVKQRQKATDEDRKADKKPHDDAGKKVQAAYNPIIEKLKKAVERVTPMQTAWLTKLEEQRRAEARRAEEEARRAEAEAARLAQQAEARNDIAGEAEAEEAAKRAAEMKKDAAGLAKKRAQVKSATGGGRTTSLRTVRSAKITNVRMLFMHYQAHPDVAECLKRLADAEIRAAKGAPVNIPGIEVIEERKAV